VAGVRSCSVTFGSSQTGFFSGSALADAGSPNGTQVLEGIVTFPLYAECGVYALSTVSCADGSGKTTSISAPDLDSILGGDALNAVAIAGGCDQTGPVFLDMTISPRNISTNMQTSFIKVAIRFSDDSSGIASCQVVLWSEKLIGLRGRFTTSVTIGDDNSLALSGNRTNGVVTLTVEVPRHSPQGVYRLNSARFAYPSFLECRVNILMSLFFVMFILALQLY
jgi:hypothetical protein